MTSSSQTGGFQFFDDIIKPQCSSIQNTCGTQYLCRWCAKIRAQVYLRLILRTFYVDARPDVGNFFRPRAVFENFWALWATFLDEPHHNNITYKEIMLKKLLRGPYSGLWWAVFGPRAGLCPTLCQGVRLIEIQ